jgi:DNA-binding NarL/FixJ family response regulator
LSKVRILIADDYEVTRRGLRSLIEAEPAWEVCGEAKTGRETVEKVEALKPDVVVLDISMPELNGLEATRRIAQSFPKPEVLILSMHESDRLTREVFEAGARGYVLKSDAACDLVAAIRALSRHKPFFTPRVSEVLLNVYETQGDTSGKLHRVRLRASAREREIIQLLAEGKSNKEIAGKLGLSVKTVETHRANIMAKLNLHSISELVRYAIRNKMIEP